MALERRTIIDQIEIRRDGTVQVRMCKQIVDSDDPDDNPISSEYHRTAVPPGDDVEAQIALIDAHLVIMRSGPCDKSEWDRLRGIVAHVHTPEVVAAFAENQARDAEKQEPPADAPNAARRTRSPESEVAP